MHPILFRIPLPDWLNNMLGSSGSLPIYSYGVMLGLSFIVGWYLTLGLSERDGLPRETMANCYVVTALSAVVASRLLYVLTNLDDFHSFGEIFEIRSGGMVAYGGFLGGLAGSWGYLRWKGIPLIPWADVAVPSLASGLMITRLGCYLYGCDFGRPLSETAPAWLKRIGTFPRWVDAITEDSSGSPAWAQHVTTGRIPPTSEWSLPVHPTQVYESLAGLGLLALLLISRRYQKFRGQIFLYFTFFYGVVRFALEFLRDDAERGSIPPALAPHVLFPLCFAGFAAAYIFGIAPAIGNKAARVATQALSVVPVVWLYLAMKPGSFEVVADVKLSTSQFIGFTTGIAAAIGFGMLYKNALMNPAGAMAMPEFKQAEIADQGDEDEPPVKAGKSSKSAKDAAGSDAKPGARRAARAAEPKASETPAGKSKKPGAEAAKGPRKKKASRPASPAPVERPAVEDVEDPDAEDKDGDASGDGDKKS